MNEVSKTARQSIPCFDFDLSVEKKGKQYIYTICREGRKLFQYIHKDPPELQNPTGQVVRGFLKKMSGEVTIKSEDVEAAVSDDKIRDKIMETLSWLGDLLLAYEDNKEQFKAELEAEKLEKQKDELSEKADEFLELLEEKHCTINEFCWYVAAWLAGGESKNIMTGFICHLSTYFKINPIWFLALGRANEGKTVIDEASLSLMPTDAILNGRITERALHRKSLKQGSDYPDGKIWKMGDLGGKRDIEKWADTIDRYKELTTEGRTEIEVTSESIDEETGERDVISFVVEGKCSVSLTSVNSEAFDDQILSRAVTVSPVATNEEVRDFFYYNQGDNKKKREYILSQEKRKLQEYIKYTKEFYEGIRVINPYWTCLEKWFRSSEFYKRALNLYPSLVIATTILNHEFRESVEIKDDLYLISSKEDNQLVADIFNPSQGISEPTVRLFNMLLKWYDPYDEGEYDEYQRGNVTIKKCGTIFTVGMVRLKAGKIKALRGLPYSDMLWSLVSHDLIQVVGKVKRGSGNENVYALSRNEKLESTTIEFDDKEISKYVKDLELMFRVPHGTFKDMIQKDKIKPPERPNSLLERPPWISKVPQEQSLYKGKVPEGTSKPDLGTSRYRKPSKEPITNHDKLKENPLKQVEKEWEAYL